MGRLVDLFYICIYVFANVAKIKMLQEPKSSKTLLNPKSVKCIYKTHTHTHTHTHPYVFRQTLRIEIIWLEIQFRKEPHSANSLASFPHIWRLIAEKSRLETKKENLEIINI